MAGRRKENAEVRGSHAERTASMRKRVIDAAIECLGKLGYNATTFQVVTDAADVSRGAMLHHFPSRVDLMVAVAEYAAERQNRYVRRRLVDVKPGMDRYLAITQATWDAMARPPAIALLEVLAAARSDKELGARIAPVLEALEKSSADAVWEQAQSAGIADKASIDAMTHLHIAAMRGLALTAPFLRGQARNEASVDLLRRYKRGLTNELLGGRKG
jgi:AcrR family transcriptional regulator